MSIVKDTSLAPQGEMKIEWARNHMPVLAKIRARFEKEQPFRGMSIGMCMHLEMKTAVLGQTFQAGGASVAITGSNPLSTQDDVAAALARSGAMVYAWRGVTAEEHHANLLRVLSHAPSILIDDGAELSVTVHTEKKELLGHVVGACEETTTGVHRYRAMEKDGTLRYPVVAVNDALTKFLFEDCGGMMPGAKLKCIIPGGISTKVLTAAEIEPVTYDHASFNAAGSALGSGGMIVIAEGTCMVHLLQVLLRFYHHESCGQCSPCREGMGWMHRIIDRIVAGNGRPEDIDQLYQISRWNDGNTICGMGDAAGYAAIGILDKYRDEFEHFIAQKRSRYNGHLEVPAHA